MSLCNGSFDNGRRARGQGSEGGGRKRNTLPQITTVTDPELILVSKTVPRLRANFLGTGLRAQTPA